MVFRLAPLASGVQVNADWAETSQRPRGTLSQPLTRHFDHIYIKNQLDIHTIQHS